MLLWLTYLYSTVGIFQTSMIGKKNFYQRLHYLHTLNQRMKNNTTSYYYLFCQEILMGSFHIWFIFFCCQTVVRFTKNAFYFTFQFESVVSNLKVEFKFSKFRLDILCFFYDLISLMKMCFIWKEKKFVYR